MSKPSIELLNMDCMDYMATLPADRFDAIITDPPYFKVKGEGWDNQWEDPSKFLAWVGSLCDEFVRILKPNGSLYIFASPQMAGRVEVVVRERLNVLNHIVWRKGRPGYAVQGWSQKADKEAARQFIPETERVIFAEHYNSDNIARGEAGYIAKCDELRGFVFEPLREYMVAELKRSGWKLSDLNAAMGFAPRGMVETRYFGRSQWQLPTEPHYKKMREILNATGGEYLRREYEDLRREYEDLRRPFSTSSKAQYTDVWEFDPVIAYAGKHPCEKPQPLLMHMLQSSVRPGGLVYDPFFGSGSMAIAAHYYGCDFVGTELDPDYYKAAIERFNNETAQEAMF